MQQTTIQTFLEADLPRYLDVMRQMVEINSFTANPTGINAVGALTAEAFAPLGFVAEAVQATDARYGKHLVLTKRGADGPTIGIVSHLDTVFTPEEEQQHDFHWRIEGDRIYGPGTGDIKGGTVLALMSLAALRHVAPAAFDAVTWVILCNAAEEVLAPDFGALCRARLHGARACLVFEGGQFSARKGEATLVAARKGSATFRVAAEGRAAHAGNHHWRGANAIVALAEVIQRIASLTNYQQHITFNVGQIRGGIATNRVPHHAEVDVEMRAFDPAVFESGIANMLALQGPSPVGSAHGDFQCQISVVCTERTLPWPRNPGTDQLIATWRAAGTTLGIKIDDEERGGLSDGNGIWQRVPTLDGLGVAAANAHCSERSADGSKDQEYALLSSLVPKATLNATAMLRLIEDTSADSADTQISAM